MVKHFQLLRELQRIIKNRKGGRAGCQALDEEGRLKVQMAHQSWTCCEMDRDQVSPVQLKIEEGKDTVLDPLQMRLGRVVLLEDVACLEGVVIVEEVCLIKISAVVLKLVVVDSSLDDLLRIRKNHCNSTMTMILREPIRNLRKSFLSY